MEQIEEEKRKKAEEELKECNKKFKATPIPTHVYQPLFEEKQKEEEIRKLRLQLQSKEYLESVPKPFNFVEFLRARAEPFFCRGVGVDGFVAEMLYI